MGPAQAFDAFVSRDERLLRCILRRLGRTQHAQAEVVDAVLVDDHKAVERVQIALTAAFQQLLLVRFRLHQLL